MSGAPSPDAVTAGPWLGTQLPAARVWLWLLLIAAGSILTQGYTWGIINHGIQIPLMRLWAGDTAFAQDPFITEMASSYTTVFYPAVGVASRYVPLPVLLFVLFVVLRLATLGLGFVLGRTMFSDDVAGLWTAALLGVQTPTFAWDIVSDIYLTHGALAQVLILVCLLALARGRTVWAFFWAGLLFNVHGMHASHLMLALGVSVLSTVRNRHGLLELGAGSALSLALAVPTLVWMKESGALGAPVPDGYVQAIRDWFPAHHWPSTWGVLEWTLLLFPLGAAWPLYALSHPLFPGGNARGVARLGWTALMLGMATGLLVELWPQPTLVRFTGMRMSFLVALCGAPFLARAALQLTRALDRKDLPDARFSAATGVMLLMGLGLSTLYRNAYWLTLTPALWMIQAYRQGRSVNHLALLLVAGALGWPALLTWSGARELPTNSADPTPHAFFLIEGLVAGFAVAAVVAAYLRRTEGPHRGLARRVLIQSAVLLAALHLAGRSVTLLAKSRSGAFVEWREVQHWCGDHLQPGQRVMVPLTQMGLRTFSNQIPALDTQEGNALFHNPGYVDTFMGKLKLYGWERGEIRGFGHFQRLDPLDRDLSTQDGLRVARGLGVTVAVRRVRHPPWALPELFRNASFVIYSMEEPPPPKDAPAPP